MPEPAAIRVTKTLPFPAAEVWRVLTEPELHAKWWANGDVQPIVGHRFTLHMGPWGAQQCEVTAVEPLRLFSYIFSQGAMNTPITFRLEPEANGTRVSFEQSGFDLELPPLKTAFDGMSAGWPRLIEKIGVVLAA